jgi:Type II CAAX prenyl endopeptidase Rce1-like
VRASFITLFLNYAMHWIITIELFFRGLLIVTLSRVLGVHAIVPVALFYFSIHLGKPMLEAISSFFGGLILGAVSIETKSIWGGWMVHCGIALFMELLAHLF